MSLSSGSSPASHNFIQIHIFFIFRLEWEKKKFSIKKKKNLNNIEKVYGNNEELRATKIRNSSFFFYLSCFHSISLLRFLCLLSYDIYVFNTCLCCINARNNDQDSKDFVDWNWNERIRWWICVSGTCVGNIHQLWNMFVCL